MGGTGGGGKPGEEMGSEGGGGRRREPRLFVRPSVWSVATGGGGRGAAPPPPYHLGPGSPGHYHKDIVNRPLLTSTHLERGRTHGKEQNFKFNQLQTKNIHIHRASSASY